MKAGLILPALLLWAGPAASSPVCPPQVVDASTLDKKLMMGYQGWFGAPGDGSKDSAWFHWFGGKGSGAVASRASFEMFPDVSEYGRSELYPTEIPGPDGAPMMVYSAYNWPTVARHFKWMRDYGVDGVMLQRFNTELSNPRLFDFRNKVTSYVAAASEHYGRAFCVMYDLSGDKDLDNTVMRDWPFLVDKLRVTRSPSYLKHKGLPLVALWGIGFKGRPQTLEQARRLIAFFKDNPNPAYRATVMGGVPMEWRDRKGGSRPELEWRDVYRSLDVISPWTVGGYRDNRSVDAHRRNFLAKDMWAAKLNGQDYMPVVWPGFSWKNLHQGPLNQIPRMGGKFYWRQVTNALAEGAGMIYTAMFDEVDEGTAMFKVVASKSQLPIPSQLPPKNGFLALDADGDKLPSDWYLRLAGQASRALRGEFKPEARLPIRPEDPASAVFSCP